MSDVLSDCISLHIKVGVTQAKIYISLKLDFTLSKEIVSSELSSLKFEILPYPRKFSQLTSSSRVRKIAVTWSRDRGLPQNWTEPFKLEG